MQCLLLAYFLLHSTFFLLVLGKKYFSTKKSVKRLSKSATLSTVSAYSFIISSKQFHIEHTHIFLGCRVSKQTFKSLQKYQILPICISFFFCLHLEMAEMRPKLAWKPNEPFGFSVTLQRAFQTCRPFISANDCCTLLNLNVRTQGETLRLHREGKAVTSKLHQFRGEKTRERSKWEATTTDWWFHLRVSV